MTEKKVPMRMCVVCRAMKDKRTLLRVVKTPDGQVMIDRKGKASGRGAYVCSDPKCRAKCAKTKFFNKLFGMQVPDAIYAELLADVAAQIQSPDPGNGGAKETDDKDKV